MLVTFGTLGAQGLGGGTPHPTPATQNFPIVPIVRVSGYLFGMTIFSHSRSRLPYFICS